MRIVVRVAVVVFALLCACSAGSEKVVRIPDGTYVAGTGAGAETILVTNPKIRFLLNLEKDGKWYRVDRGYETYAVDRFGRLTLRPILSSEFLAGIGSFDWRWDGTQIVQTAPRNRNAAPKLFRREVKRR